MIWMKWNGGENNMQYFKMVTGMEWNSKGQEKRGRYLGWNEIGEDWRKEDGIWDGMEWEGQEKRGRYLGWNGMGRTGEKRTVCGMEWNGRGQKKRRRYLGTE